MQPIRVGLMLAPAEDLREAALPLFEEGIVGALEWSLDLGWGPHGVPDWADALLSAYEEAGRLYAHGVEFSLLSAAPQSGAGSANPSDGEWRSGEPHSTGRGGAARSRDMQLEPRQRAWLARLERDMHARKYVHLSEHYGWMTAGRFTNGTPLPHPKTEEAIALGRERIEMIRAIAEVPVGLENLAFAFGAKDVDDQPSFIDELLSPSDGFLLLDVHNLYCQAVNYDRDPIALMDRYPLDRVRELHVAGGTIATTGGGPFRRDGHDGHVPPDVLPLVARAVAHCPKLEVIILEHTDHHLATDAALERYRNDFHALRSIVNEAGRGE